MYKTLIRKGFSWKHRAPFLVKINNSGFKSTSLLYLYTYIYIYIYIYDFLKDYNMDILNELTIPIKSIVVGELKCRWSFLKWLFLYKYVYFTEIGQVVYSEYQSWITSQKNTWTWNSRTFYKNNGEEQKLFLQLWYYVARSILWLLSFIARHS